MHNLWHPAAASSAESLLALRSSRTAVSLVPMEAAMGLPLAFRCQKGRGRWLLPFFTWSEEDRTGLSAVLLADGQSCRILAWLSAESRGDWPVCAPEPEGDLLDYLLALEALDPAAADWNRQAAALRRRMLGDGPCHRFLLTLASAFDV